MIQKYNNLSNKSNENIKNNSFDCSEIINNTNSNTSLKLENYLNQSKDSIYTNNIKQNNFINCTLKISNFNFQYVLLNNYSTKSSQTIFNDILNLVVEVNSIQRNKIEKYHTIISKQLKFSNNSKAEIYFKDIINFYNEFNKKNNVLIDNFSNNLTNLYTIEENYIQYSNKINKLNDIIKGYSYKINKLEICNNKIKSNCNKYMITINEYKDKIKLLENRNKSLVKLINEYEIK